MGVGKSLHQLLLGCVALHQLLLECVALHELLLACVALHTLLLGDVTFKMDLLFFLIHTMPSVDTTSCFTCNYPGFVIHL